jgi:hypothetical protein
MSGLEPTYRAVIRDGGLTLHRWSPRLIRSGPCAMALARSPASLVDLTRMPEGELVAAVAGPSRFGPEARDVLVRWAAAVGHRRVWLPGALVDLDAPAALGRARVRCPCCMLEWHDRGIEFWEHVRARRCFPERCLACGGTLPQWTVDRVPTAWTGSRP